MRMFLFILIQLTQKTFRLKKLNQTPHKAQMPLIKIMSAEGTFLRNSEEQSLSLEIALQHDGWGATTFFITSIIHFVASEINDVQPNNEKSSVVNGSGTAAAVRAIAGNAEMAMHTRNTSATFIEAMVSIWVWKWLREDYWIMLWLVGGRKWWSKEGLI